MKSLRLFSALALSFFIAIALSILATTPAMAGIDPVTADELKMTSEPLAPGAPAVILYRQVDRDDNGRTSHEDNFLRIKILTEEGRKYADVEIPFWKGNGVIAIHAKTIKPDGSTVDFDGKVYDKTITKARGLKYSAKTFTLSNVQPGSVIEYSFTYDLQENSLFESNWILSDELFTKSARFSLRPYRSSFENPFRLRWTWQGLPPGTEKPVEGPDHIIRLEAHNIPAFQTEDFMPPVNEMKARVDFIYSRDDPESDPDKYWQGIDKKWDGYLESFVGKPKAMEPVVAQIISPNDTPEMKLRKLYAKVQTLRNTSYEIRKSEQEEKREKEKPPTSIEEVWKRGYGSDIQLTWLYLGLVRAAGFDAYGCWVSSRRQYFFEKKVMQSHKLNTNVVLVKLDGKDLYLDPGVQFTPFGLLTWSETGVPGLRLDKNGGGFIMTTLPPSKESQIQREAKLKLSDGGDLEGTLRVTYTGLEAMYRRLDERNTDDVARKKFLEEQLKEQVPAAAELELTNKPEWGATETPLIAEFSLKVPGWASNAGKRVTMPVGLFSAHEKRVFEHAVRVHPIYFEYPYGKLDDVTVELPEGWQVSSAPPDHLQDGHVIVYSLKVENNQTSVHIVRKLDVNILLMEQKYYSALRNFFQAVRTGDEEQILLQPAAASASN